MMKRMTEPDSKPSAHVELIRATQEQEPILANLLQLYAHDFSEFHDVELDADGRFVYKQLPLYWSEPNRHPFLIKIDGKLGGFVLVKKGSEISGNGTVWDMAEFFVIRGYRRRGIGTQIAYEVWKRFPGTWEVRVMQSNISAHEFWTHAISTFAGKVIDPVRVEIDGECWKLFTFESKQIDRC